MRRSDENGDGADELIGNALKYSDDCLRVAWRAHGELLLLAVLDQGKAGQGTTRGQAGALFTAFGRIETHAAIEGTGSGLLSVQPSSNSARRTDLDRVIRG